MARITWLILLAALLLAGALAAAACGGGPSPSASPTSAAPSASPPASASPTVTVSPSPSPSPARLTTVSVYLMRGQYVGAAHRVIPATIAPAGVAMRELLAGPNARERAAGLHSNIPAGTRLLGLTIRGGVATVDLSPEFARGVDPLEDRGRLAQVVYTLTQFATVDSVRFRVGGSPLVFREAEGTPQTAPQTRGSFEDVTPAIFVERPAVGDHVGSPLVVTGTANTFEAQFMIRIRDAAGRRLVNRSAMATSGTGTRGTFNEAVAFSTASATITLEVYEQSAASGLPIHLVKIPLRMAPQGGE